MVRRLKLTAIVCFALLGVAAAVVWHWVRVDHAYPGPRDKYIIGTVLGWKVPDDHRDFGQMVARNPLPVLQLLAHDSKRVRRWAELILTHYGEPDGLNDDLLNLISAELSEKNYYDYGYDQRALIRILASAGERGTKRLALLYRSKRPVDPILHGEICSQAANGALLNALLEVEKDDTVLLENRCRAMEVLGYMRKPDPVSGSTKTDESAIAELTDLLPHLPEPIATVARASLQKIERDESKREDPHYPGDGQVVSPAKDGGADALAALKDKADWLRVGIAAEELARHDMKDAIPELQRVATNHWYPPVRKTAEQAIRILRGQEPALPERTHPGPPELVGKFQHDATQAWREEHRNRLPAKTVRDDFLRWLDSVAHALKPARDAVFWRLQPNFDRVLVQKPGRLPQILSVEDLAMASNMKPKEAIRFAGGKLLVYNEGEFGSGTVFYRKGEIPLFFDTGIVEGFVRTPYGMLLVCDGVSYLEYLFIATEQPNGRVSIQLLTRLPEYSGWPEVLPSGETRILTPLGDVIISPTGEIRMVDKPAK